LSQINEAVTHLLPIGIRESIGVTEMKPPRTLQRGEPCGSGSPLKVQNA